LSTRFFRPRSIVRLVFLGFAAVAIPLIAAVITAVVQVDRLAQRNRQAVLDAETATHESRALIEHLTGMERSFGQYEVLADRDFYLNYVSSRAGFDTAARRLMSLDLGVPLKEELRKLVVTEAALNRALVTPTGQPSQAVSPPRTADQWAQLHGQARAILAASSELITRHANKARDESARLQRTLLLQAAAAVPVAVLLGLTFAFLIARPLRQFDAQIRRLGAGSFADEVQVSGPQDLEELGRSLDWLRRRILDLEEQKALFLRRISHELKTPLTTIREGSELLLDENAAHLNHEQREIAQIMRESGQHLQRLIEDLLQFGKTQTPQPEPSRAAQVALDDVVRTAIDQHSLSRNAKSLQLDARLSPVNVRGDANQLRTVVDNLLSNAIKYTPQHGRIAVSLATEGDQVTLEVADDGPGIDADERTSVFEPFYQGRAPYVGHVQGTGLGLTIAKQYVEAHDGRIEICDSPLGRGTCVRVRFRQSEAA
jgi:two-component system sensor histidine kinase GlrK